MPAAGHPHDRYGADHPNMATRHSNLGTVPVDLGDLTDAAPTTGAPWRLAKPLPTTPWSPSATTSTMLCSSLVVRSARATG